MLLDTAYARSFVRWIKLTLKQQDAYDTGHKADYFSIKGT
jgi:hypothetical protein